jgi:antitoxin (DNA-binding transcriptional repressor) of toxin-antitoxin stability system
VLTDVPVDAAAHRFKEILEEMEPGQTIRVVAPDGGPIALVVSLRDRSDTAKASPDWDADWDALAERIDKAWRSEKSAVEIVSEMRE